MDFPLPVPDAMTEPYWRALDQGHIVFQRCQCAHAWLPARKFCPQCLGDNWQWTRAAGKGRLLSWVVYHTAYHPAFAERLPYNVALVELDEGPRLITNMVDPSGSLRADARVQLCVQREQGVALARFRQLDEEVP
jgi:uncharacterized protein